MYNFAVAALLGLAVLTAVKIVETLIPSLAANRTIVTAVVAIGGAFALDYSVFAGFGQPIENEAVAKIVTGIILMGLVSVWQAALSYLGTKEAPASKSTTPRSIAA